MKNEISTDKFGTGVRLRGEFYGKKRTDVLTMLNNPKGLVVEGRLLRVLNEQGFNLDPETDNKSVYNPDELFVALQRYDKIPSFRPHGSAFKRAVGLAFKQFGFHESEEKLRKITKEDTLMRSIKLDKSSGAPLFSKKGDAFQSDLDRAYRILEGKCAPPPCVAYHRVQHGDEGPKTRLVWGYPLSMTLIEAMYARPLINKFLDSRTPIAFGERKFEVAARINRFQQLGVTYSVDYSKFDSTLSYKMIKIAFDILKTHFDCVDEHEWSTIFRYFIKTSIIMPDGNIYVKSHGVPSGSYFTQLVGSICNYIALQYIAIRLTSHDIPAKDTMVLGDDSLFGLSEWFSLEEVSKLASELGLVVNAGKSRRARRGEDLHFLGHDWHGGLADRPVDEVAKRVVFPEYWDNSGMSNHSRQRSRALSYLADSISSWKIYRTLGYAEHNDVQRLLVFREPFQNITGWQEFQTMNGGELIDSRTSGIMGPFL